MTYPQRRKYLYISYLILFALLTFISILLILIGKKFGSIVSDFAPVLFRSISLTIFLLGIIGYLFLSFRKSVTPEIFFFCFFLMGLFSEQLKVLQLYFQLINAANYLQLLVTRFIYISRFFSAISLFSGSLFSTGFEARKMGNLFWITIFIALLIGINVLIIPDVSGNNYIHDIGNMQMIHIILVVIMSFSIINYLFGWYKSQNAEYSVVCLAMILIMAGAIILVSTTSLLLYFGSMLLILIGTLLFSIRMHSIYLWM